MALVRAIALCFLHPKAKPFVHLERCDPSVVGGHWLHDAFGIAGCTARQLPSQPFHVVSHPIVPLDSLDTVAACTCFVSPGSYGAEALGFKSMYGEKPAFAHKVCEKVSFLCDEMQQFIHGSFEKHRCLECNKCSRS